MTMEVSSSDPTWNAWYELWGSEHIALRKAVYLAGLPADAELFQLEEKTLELVGFLGSRSLDTIVDVGCSDASWLGELRQCGHQGLLVGVEPNAGQFGDRPYRESKDGEVLGVSKADSANEVLIKSNAQSIPLADKLADVTLMQLAMYHIPKSEQPHALEELKRITNDSGAVIITTRGENNKQTMNETRQRIAYYLARLRNEEIIPPANLNGDFTTEDGRDLLPQHFSYVYEFTHHADLVFDTPDKFDVLQDAQATFRGLYKTINDEPLTFPFAAPVDNVYRKEYEWAFLQAEIGKLLDIREQPIIDSQDDAVFVCSNEPQASLASLGYRLIG